MPVRSEADCFTEYQRRVSAATDYLRQTLPYQPDIVIQLGTGLGGFATAMASDCQLAYADIPGFPQATVTSHRGRLLLGQLSGHRVAILQGRFHYYEGYTARETALPLRVLALLGAKTLLLTNASGGLNLALRAGDIMLITDHLFFLPDNPLRGPHIDAWGPRFPDLSKTYTPALQLLAQQAARSCRLGSLPVGTYACVAGPSLETPAETRWLRNGGADAVGMSSVPEILVASQAGMQVLALAVIANVNDPDNFQPVSLEDIIVTAESAGQRLQQLLLAVLAMLPESHH